MRAFVAVDVDASPFANELDDIRRRVGCAARFVGPRLMHVTLKFLGDVPEHRISVVKRALDSLAGFGGLHVALRGLGAFPRPSRPRVLWIGAESQKLAVLAEAVESLLRGTGPPPREFHGHVTLARMRGPCDLRGLLGDYRGFVFSEFDVHAVSLKESILSSGGTIYRKVHEVTIG